MLKLIHVLRVRIRRVTRNIVGGLPRGASDGAAQRLAAAVLLVNKGLFRGVKGAGRPFSRVVFNPVSAACSMLAGG
ncbi:MAG: hypothetical protein PHO94_08585, partial [Petrimonas sp.]|nr:hypothetical protein [Petrimonas sp.]